MFFFLHASCMSYYMVGMFLQIHAAELVPFEEQFAALALCFVTLTIELDSFVLQFSLEFITFVQEFFMAPVVNTKGVSRSCPSTTTLY